MLKKFKPVTPSTRNLIRLKNLELAKKPLLKNKNVGLNKNAGRNNLGRITSWNKGGGHKRKYREINFFRNLNGYWMEIVFTFVNRLPSVDSQLFIKL